MSDELRRLTSFSDPIEAELALHCLLDADIQATLSGDLTGSAFDGLGYTVGGLDLLVPESQLERSRITLAALADDMERRKQGEDVSKFEDALDDSDADRKTAEETKPAKNQILIDRAFRASLLGLLLCPMFPVVHTYSLVLLLMVVFDPDGSVQRSSAKYYAALAIDIAVLGFDVLLYGGRLWLFR
jgi:hypothetical protein